MAANRVEKSVVYTDSNGLKKTYRILEHVTIDDLMVLCAKSVAADYRNSTVSGSPLSYGIKDHLVRLNVSTGTK